jgi:hypothetical protein
MGKRGAATAVWCWKADIYRRRHAASLGSSRGRGAARPPTGASSRGLVNRRHLPKAHISIADARDACYGTTPHTSVIGTIEYRIGADAPAATTPEAVGSSR